MKRRPTDAARASETRRQRESATVELLLSASDYLVGDQQPKSGPWTTAARQALTPTASRLFYKRPLPGGRPATAAKKPSSLAPFALASGLPTSE